MRIATPLLAALIAVAGPAAPAVTATPIQVYGAGLTYPMGPLRQH